MTYFGFVFQLNLKWREIIRKNQIERKEKSVYYHRDAIAERGVAVALASWTYEWTK